MQVGGNWTIIKFRVFDSDYTIDVIVTEIGLKQDHMLPVASSGRLSLPI